MRGAAWVLALGSMASAGYGIWVAASVWHEVPLLMAFAALACTGALLGLVGAVLKQSRWVACGALAQLLAPTAFAWVLSLLIAVAGAVLLAVSLRRARSARSLISAG